MPQLPISDSEFLEIANWWRALKRQEWSYRNLIGQDKEWAPFVIPRIITATTSLNPLNGLVRADASGGSIVINLETAMAAGGRIHYIKKTDASANTVTLDAYGSETINGSPSFILSEQHDAVIIVSNESGWDIFAGFGSIVGSGGGSGGGTVQPCWARVAADGTVLASRRVAGVSRVGEGVYDVSLDFTAPTVGGEIELAAVATPSSTVGDGGLGTIPYKAYSSHDAVASDTDAHMVKVDATNEIWVMGATADLVYIHDLSNFTAAATTINTSNYIRNGALTAGCLSSDQAYVWLSGDSSAPTTPVRAINTSTRAVTNFGTNTDLICLGANATYLICREITTVKVFTPNFGASSLGSGTSAFADSNCIRRGCWDANGRFWFTNTTGIVQMRPAVPAHVQHPFPTGFTTVISDPIYDESRRCIYIGLSNGTVGRIYRYQGWVDDVANSSTQTSLFEFVDTTGCRNLWFDRASDVLFVGDSAKFFAYRYYLGSGGLRIDTVKCWDDSSAVVQYTMGTHTLGYYNNGYGYFLGTHSASRYLVRIEYNGAEIDFGGGSSLVSAVLLAHTNVIDDETVRVELFRQMSPILRADGEFSVSIESGT